MGERAIGAVTAQERPLWAASKLQVMDSRTNSGAYFFPLLTERVENRDYFRHPDTLVRDLFNLLIPRLNPQRPIPAREMRLRDEGASICVNKGYLPRKMRE
jgi:hypothetical protein